MDWREVFDIARERPASPIRDGDPVWRRLTGPNQWPTDVPELRPVLLDWFGHIERLGKAVTTALEDGLGCGRGGFRDWFGEQAHVRVKLLHYPPRPDHRHEQGAGVHTDRGFMTFIAQDQVSGLRVSPYDDGTWTDVPPRAGMLVLNFGEMSEVATGGFIRATPHRVVAPPPGVDRYSVIGFYNPHLDAELTPVALPAEEAARARGVRNDRVNPYLSPFGRNEFKEWLRGHPHVAAVHYPDQLAAARRNGTAPGARGGLEAGGR